MDDAIAPVTRLRRVRFSLVLLHHVIDRLELGDGEILAHLRRAAGSLHRWLRLTLEMGHHLSSEQLGGPLRRRWVRPLVSQLKQAAKPTRLVPQALDLGTARALVFQSPRRLSR